MNAILEALCLADTQTLLETLGGEYHKEHGYTFIDNGSNVLAVCHLDVVDDYDKVKKHRSYAEYRVTNKREAKRLKVTANRYPFTLAESIALDDRLGLYIIYDLLPRMGVMPDILLTTNEEVGRPTGRNFVPAKQYNWMFQFDRHGTGTVMYQYQDDEMKALLQSNGYRMERGSFSDISVMEHLNCKGFNFGVGYQEEHTDWCWCNLEEVYQLALNFSAFYSKYEYTAMPHTPVVYSFDRKTGGRYGELWTRTRGLDGTDDNDLDDMNDLDLSDKFYLDRIEFAYCLSCGMEMAEEDLVEGLCYDCIYEMDMDAWDDFCENDPNCKDRF